MLVAAEAPAHTPNARPCSSPLKLAVMIDNDPGTRKAPAAPWRTRAMIRNSIVGATPHSSEVAANARSPNAKTRLRP